MAKQLVERAAPRAHVHSVRNDLRALKAEAQMAAQKSYAAHAGQDVRAYASFVPLHSKIQVSSWPKL